MQGGVEGRVRKYGGWVPGGGGGIGVCPGLKCPLVLMHRPLPNTWPNNAILDVGSVGATIPPVGMAFAIDA